MSVRVNAPDPEAVRRANLTDVEELGFPTPPETFPLVWDAGDEVALRSRLEIETRCVILHTLLAAGVGAPRDATLGWLERNNIDDSLTADERTFLADGEGVAGEYILCIEALWALAWVLGVADELDPTQYTGDGLATWLPSLDDDESFEQWRVTSPVRLREAEDVATLLDLYYCLDWGNAQALAAGDAPYGVTQPYVIGQRRWALEWVVVFTGAHHERPPEWDEVEMGY